MTDLLALLQEFYRDKLAALVRHEAVARGITQYDVNNAYQHIINREDVQLSWLSSAITELGGALDVPSVQPDLARTRSVSEKAEHAPSRPASPVKTLMICNERARSAPTRSPLSALLGRAPRCIRVRTPPP